MNKNAKTSEEKGRKATSISKAKISYKTHERPQIQKAVVKKAKPSPKPQLISKSAAQKATSSNVLELAKRRKLVAKNYSEISDNEDSNGSVFDPEDVQGIEYDGEEEEEEEEGEEGQPEIDEDAVEELARINEDSSMMPLQDPIQQDQDMELGGQNIPSEIRESTNPDIIWNRIEKKLNAKCKEGIFFG